MTLSNFDWTDKNSVKWFILLASGHEGPYSLSNLEQQLKDKKINSDVKVWAEGLAEPIVISSILAKFNHVPEIPKDEVPDLPPLPVVEEEEETPPPFEEFIPPLPEEEVPPPPKTRKLWPFALGIGLLMLAFIFAGMVKNFEKISIRRYPKMPVELHEKILKDVAFEGWDKNIFFKEYLPVDHSQIWLVTSSFQSCKVDATFQSLEGKLLTPEDEKISFKSSGTLANHVVELSTFDFASGSKIIPGMYEMDIKATDCTWDGIIPRIMNKFVSPAENYVARTKVVLFYKGAAEFNRILDKLLKQKIETELRAQTREDLFWQDLQQKLQTLEAIALQIENHFLEFLDRGNFQPELKSMVDQYTRKFGSFLTNFVVENDKYFKTLDLASVKGGSQRQDYELMVRLTSKRIGFESMKFIEEFQAKKGKPTAKQLEEYSSRIRRAFAAIKNDITQKILQVSEDRAQ